MTQNWLVHLVSVLILTLLSTNLSAQTCPEGTSKTKIYFVNGIDNTRKNAKASKEKLEETVIPKIQLPLRKECIEFDLSYNQNNFLFLDLVESYSQLVSSSFTDFWRFFARTIAANDRIEQALLRIFSVDRQSYISDATLNEFTNDYYDQIANQKKTVILASHSQGNFYANESYRLINPLAPNKLKVVAIATPDSFVGGAGPHTTLLGDLIWSIIGALFPNVDNGPCGIFWQCHSFLKSYMKKDTDSQIKIVDDVISAIPLSPVLPPLLAQPCFSRDIFGNRDIFWGDPPPLDINQPSPRQYPNTTTVRGGIVTLSVEGERWGSDGPTCVGVIPLFEIYRDGSNLPVTSLTGGVLNGSDIVVGNLGTTQFFVWWPNNLPNGTYRFRVLGVYIFAGGPAIFIPINSVLSTNTLTVG